MPVLLRLGVWIRGGVVEGRYVVPRIDLYRALHFEWIGFLIS